MTHLEITIQTPDAEVPALIGQDPMGCLDKPVTIGVGGHAYVAVVAGYVSTNGRATVTLYATEWEGA